MSDPYSIRPDPPVLPPDLQHEPMQADPTLNEGRAGPIRIGAAALAIAIVVGLVLFGMTRDEPQPNQQTASVPAPPPAATNGPGTTGQGGVTPQSPAANSSANPPAASGQARPQPTEQDPVEQSTRP